jgi:hydrogenase maturation protease
LNVKPVLLFGYGNPSRGDDALGPMLLEAIENSARVDRNNIEMLTDFQLQIEHALDLESREQVVFVDASVACVAPFEFSKLQPEYDDSYTTHEMSPAAVLQVYQSVNKALPPPCFLLSIKAGKFELGEELSASARENLLQACAFTEKLLAEPKLTEWLKLTSNARNIAA